MHNVAARDIAGTAASFFCYVCACGGARIGTKGRFHIVRKRGLHHTAFGTGGATAYAEKKLHRIVSIFKGVLQYQVRVQMRKVLSSAYRRDILASQSFTCGHAGLCRDPDLTGGRPFHIDHIVAKCNGGSDVRSNLQALCVECHAVKTIEDIKLWRASIALEGDTLSLLDETKSLHRINDVAMQTKNALSNLVARMQNFVPIDLPSNATCEPNRRNGKRKRYHGYGEMRHLAQPLIGDEAVLWKTRIEKACRLHDVRDVDVAVFTERIISVVTYYRSTFGNRVDNYFFADGLIPKTIKMRSAAEVARAFLHVQGHHRQAYTGLKDVIEQNG